jgi:hypothetical protein
MAYLTSYNRGVRQLMMASWGGVNAPGTAYSVIGIRQANLSFVVDSDKARGDDVDLDRFTKVVSVQLTIAQAAVDLKVLNLVMGGALIGGTQYYDLTVDNINDPPYLVIAGRIVGSNNQGDLHFLIPKAKLSSTPQFNAQVDTYIFPQMQFEGVYEGTVNGMLKMRHFFQPATLNIPLPLVHD